MAVAYSVFLAVTSRLFSSVISFLRERHNQPKRFNIHGRREYFAQDRINLIGPRHSAAKRNALIRVDLEIVFILSCECVFRSRYRSEPFSIFLVPKCRYESG